MSRYMWSGPERRGAVVIAVTIVLCTLAIWDATRRGGPTQRQAQRQTTYYAQPKQEVETFAFDPNLADSTQLLRLGLSPSMVRGIYKYRAKNGVYSTPEDFARVPGMTQEMWQRLAPMIVIDQRFQRVDLGPRVYQRNVVIERKVEYRGDTLPARQSGFERRDKIALGQKLPLNASDTTELKRVPGIWSYRAQKIVAYRERLGGFNDLNQLDEIANMDPEIKQYLYLDTVPLRKVNLNTAERSELSYHPYIGTEVAKLIISYRHNKARITPQNLASIPGIGANFVARLLPYADF